MSSIVRLCLVGLVTACFCLGCDTPPDMWDVSAPDVDWGTPVKDTEPIPVEETDSETETETWTEPDIETETEDSELPTDTGTGKPNPEKKSCRESMTCLFQNSSNPMSCLTQADPEAQKLLVGIIGCLTTNGCFKDLQDIQNLITCAMSKCGTEFMACMADS